MMPIERVNEPQYESSHSDSLSVRNDDSLNEHSSFLFRWDHRDEVKYATTFHIVGIVTYSLKGFLIKSLA